MKFIKSILCIPQLILSLNRVNKHIETLAGAISHTQNKIKVIEKDVKRDRKISKDLQDRIGVIEAFFDNLEEIQTSDKNNLAN
jgi:hypothetical protein